MSRFFCGAALSTSSAVVQHDSDRHHLQYWTVHGTCNAKTTQTLGPSVFSATPSIATSQVRVHKIWEHVHTWLKTTAIGLVPQIIFLHILYRSDMYSCAILFSSKGSDFHPSLKYREALLSLIGSSKNVCNVSVHSSVVELLHIPVCSTRRKDFGNPEHCWLGRTYSGQHCSS